MCQAIKWDQQVTSPGPISAAEHKKISDIKFLNPFKTKKTEFLVTVTVNKNQQLLMGYNSCHKCARTVKPHDDLYKCTDSRCGHIGSPAPRSVDFTCLYLLLTKTPLNLYSYA
jgi:replication factor A1